MFTLKMNWLTGMLLVLFPLLDVIDLIMDGVFFHNVKSNSNHVLSQDEAKDYKAIILTFVVVGIMGSVINIGYIIVTVIQHRKLECKDSEITVPLQLSPFMTWLEDVPQIVICLIVAFKIEAFLSEEIQLAKAIFTIAKSMLYLAYFWLTKGKERSYWLYYADIIGNGLLLVCSIVLLARLGRPRSFVLLIPTATI